MKTSPKLFHRNPKGTGNKIKVNHNQNKKQRYALMARYATGKLAYATDYINSSLAIELEDFKKFRKQEHRCAETTIQKDVRFIFQILGWLHRYKDIALEDLSLTSIITHIKLNVSIKEFKKKLNKSNSQLLTPEERQQFTFEKALLREESSEIANESKNLIKEYLDFVGGHPNSKLIALTRVSASQTLLTRGLI